MENTMTICRTYAYEGETFASLQALANELYYEYGFTGDLKDYEYLMYYIDGITEEEADEICDIIRDLYADGCDCEDDMEFDYEEEID